MKHGLSKEVYDKIKKVIEDNKDYLEYSGIIEGIGNPREIYLNLFENLNKKFANIL